MNLLKIFGVVCLSIFFSGVVMADSMQCGQALISTGDSKTTVLRKCGEPTLKETVSGGSGSRAEVVEQWIYDSGNNQFPRILTFKGLELVQIKASTEP